MGNLEWEQTYGGSKNDYAYQAIIAHDSGYIITGNTFPSDGDVSFHHGDRDVWVVKISAEGMLEWERCYGGSAIDSGSCISRTSDGGYIIGGTTGSNDGDIQCTKGLGAAW